MIEKGFLHEIPSNSSLIANKSKTRRGETRCAAKYLASSLLAVLALMAIAVAPALGQDGGVKIRGNVQFLYGQWDVDGANNDPNAEDIDGAIMSTESNLFVEGENGPMDWQFRFRIRGRDRPGRKPEKKGDTPAGDFSAAGQAGNVGSGGLQTVRGHLVWHVTDAFSVAGRRDGTHPTATVTENDPIQNLPCACRLGETSDEPFLDLRLTYGPIMFGGMLAPSPGTSMQLNGKATGGPGSGGGANAAGDSGSQLIGGYFQYKQAGFLISAYAAIASADADTDNDGTTDFDGDSTAAQVHLIIPIAAGALKFDVETVTSDLDPLLNNGESEEEQIFVGFLLELFGLRAGINQGVQEIGAFEKTQTNLTAHYRFAVTENAWVGPEIQMQTIELDDPANPGAADEEITSIAFLMSTRF